MLALYVPQGFYSRGGPLADCEICPNGGQGFTTMPTIGAADVADCVCLPGVTFVSSGGSNTHVKHHVRVDHAYGKCLYLIVDVDGQEGAPLLSRMASASTYAVPAKRMAAEWQHWK
jgi:hypothetical protein